MMLHQKNEMVILNNLPVDHPLRNVPLKDINAKYKWKKASDRESWRLVTIGAPKLSNKTFNDLGDSWTDFDWWMTEDVM